MSRPETALRARLLGTLTFCWGGAPVTPPSRKAAWLLALVVLRPDGVRRAELAGLLWPPGRLGSVRQALHVLRALPGADAWLEASDPVRVRASSDVEAFERACDEDRFEAALAAWGGPLFGEDGLAAVPEPLAEWLEVERARLEQRRRVVVHAHLRSLRARAEHAAALQLARAELALDPLDESLHQAAIAAAAAIGRLDDALALFERCRTVLRDELGVEPLPETLELLATIESGAAARAPVAHLVRESDDVPAAPTVLVGRDALVDDLVARVAAGERLLLQGLGGVGKSALAAAVARTVARSAPCLWLTLGDLAPESAFDAIASALDGGDVPGGAERAAHASAAMTTAGLRLLVLDDAHNAYTVARVRDALPSGVALIVTARVRYPALVRIDVLPLDRAASLDLLQRTYREARLAACGRGGRPQASAALDDTAADALCERLGDHPFALRLAAATMASEGTDPAALHARIAAAPHALVGPDGAGGLASVVGLLESSLETLPDDAHEAYLAIGALPASSTTPELLGLLVRRSTPDADAALVCLTRRGLAWREAEPGVDLVQYRLHDLAHSHARTVTPLRPRSVVRAAQAYLARCPHDAGAHAAEQANLVGAVRIAARVRDREAVVQLMRALSRDGALYTARGLGAEGEALLREAAAAARSLGDHASRSHLLGRLGDHRFTARGDPEGALAAYAAALEAATEAGSNERMAVTSSLVGITKLRLGQGDATTHLDAALRHAAASRDPLCLSAVQEQRGYAAAESNDWQEARRWIEASLATLAAVEGAPAHGTEGERAPEVRKRRFFGLVNLGEVELRLGDAAASLASREAALAIAVAHGNEVWEAMALHELGALHHLAERRDEAEWALARALALYRVHDVTIEAAEVEAFLAEQGYARP